MTTLYGLKNCDTCKKAIKWLDRFGVAFSFIDYRDNKPAPEVLLEWADKAGADGKVAAQAALDAVGLSGHEHAEKGV